LPKIIAGVCRDEVRDPGIDELRNLFLDLFTAGAGDDSAPGFIRQGATNRVLTLKTLHGCAIPTIA
jgi:hypothetical protein